MPVDVQSWTLPPYLRTRDIVGESHIGENFMGGLMQGMALQQQKREFALKMQKLALDEHRANVDMEQQQLQIRQMRDEMEDVRQLGFARQEWKKGNFDFQPEGLRTIKVMAAAERMRAQMRTQTAEGQVQSGWDNMYADVISGPQAEPLAAADLKKYPKYSAEWAERLGNWNEIVQGKREQAKIAEFKAKQDILTEGRMEVKQIDADTRLRVREMINESVEARDKVRREIAAANSQTREADKKTFFIGRMIPALQGFKGNSKKTPKELADQAEALWDEYAGQQGSPTPAPATAPPVGRVLKWNPATNDFE